MTCTQTSAKHFGTLNVETSFAVTLRISTNIPRNDCIWGVYEPTAWNFSLCRLLIFRKKQQKSEINRSGDSSVTILLVIMISILTSGKVFEVCFAPQRTVKQAVADIVQKVLCACQACWSHHPYAHLQSSSLLQPSWAISSLLKVFKWCNCSSAVVHLSAHRFAVISR